MKDSEIQEREYLSQIKEKLNIERDEISADLKRKKQEIKEDTIFRGEARGDMDHAEKITFRQIIEEKVVTASQIIKQLKSIEKLTKTPYFGRFDFLKKGEVNAKKIYLGMSNFFDYEKKESIIYDWRAPISSMFYNYEIGEAGYEAPSGQVSGELNLKRQFRIREGEMEFMLESSVNIMDDVLQKELSRASDEGMKNIVATIQRDQNSIIRNEDSRVLIIQGVAGSGKTSIALHRIAFLLYRFKETLSSEDILIISPNKVFANYIANVLPELGEESVNEIQMEILAKEILGLKFNFQTFFEQTANLLEKEDEALKERIAFKSSAEFLKTLDSYAEHVRNNLFVSRDVNVGGCFAPAELFDDVFKVFMSLPKNKCISEVTKRIRKKIDLRDNYLLNAHETTYLKKMVTSMYQGSSLKETYIKMFAWINRPELFKLAKGSKFEYADVFPLVYLTIILEGKDIEAKAVKHLLIDEMQDYSPVQYAVINKLFSCNKTILGDANQSVNPYSSSRAETIKNIFNQASYVELNKSYRSSYEIMEFVQRISPNPNLEAMRRHGEKPEIISFKNDSEEIKEISKMANIFESSDFNSLGIICKTQKQAEKLYNELEKLGTKSQLLTNDSDSFSFGVIICTAHMAKGLEFDKVIVPFSGANNYSSLMDKSLLYVACTRAMHSLVLTYNGEFTELVSREGF